MCEVSLLLHSHPREMALLGWGPGKDAGVETTVPSSATGWLGTMRKFLLSAGLCDEGLSYTPPTVPKRARLQLSQKR